MTRETNYDTVIIMPKQLFCNVNMSCKENKLIQTTLSHSQIYNLSSQI